MLFKKSALVLAASLLALGVAQAALPAVTTNVPISIFVSTSNPATACTVTLSAPIAPLTYVSGSATMPTQGRNAIISCNGNDPIAYSVTAGPGANPTTTRRAVSGSNYIDYNLTSYAAPLMGGQFGDPTSVVGGGVITGTTLLSGSVTTGSISFNVNVPAGQTPASGTYTDTVVLTTTF